MLRQQMRNATGANDAPTRRRAAASEILAYPVQSSETTAL